jgi:plastocyanin
VTDRRGPRESLLLPVAIPVGSLAIIGAVLFLFSRVLLRVTATTATIIALITAASVLGIASYVASRRQRGGVAMMSMVAGVFGAALLAGGVGLLVGQPTPEVLPTVVQLVAPPGADTEGFATTSLSAPAGEPFEIAFDNQENGVQHDVVIATGDPAKDSSAEDLFTGQVISGPAQITYNIDPLDAGTYFFYCQIHPATMTGSLTVAAAPPLAPEGGGGAAVQLTAANLAFDKSELDLTAGADTSLDFTNNDAGTQHNVAIYTDSSAATALFQGELVTGPGSTTYTIPSLDPGQYYFRCDVHTTMNGTVVVSKPSGGGPGGGQGAGGQGGGGQGGGGGPPPGPTSASSSPSG